jgi:hypothetical protein
LLGADRSSRFVKLLSFIYLRFCISFTYVVYQSGLSLQNSPNQQNLSLDFSFDRKSVFFKSWLRISFKCLSLAEAEIAIHDAAIFQDEDTFAIHASTRSYQISESKLLGELQGKCREIDRLEAALKQQTSDSIALRDLTGQQQEMIAQLFSRLESTVASTSDCSNDSFAPSAISNKTVDVSSMRLDETLEFSEQQMPSLNESAVNDSGTQTDILCPVPKECKLHKKQVWLLIILLGFNNDLYIILFLNFQVMLLRLKMARNILQTADLSNTMAKLNMDIAELRQQVTLSTEAAQHVSATDMKYFTWLNIIILRLASILTTWIHSWIHLCILCRILSQHWIVLMKRMFIIVQIWQWIRMTTLSSQRKSVTKILKYVGILPFFILMIDYF